jgi:hypothetical protein
MASFHLVSLSLFLSLSLSLKKYWQRKPSWHVQEITLKCADGVKISAQLWFHRDETLHIDSLKPQLTAKWLPVKTSIFAPKMSSNNATAFPDPKRHAFSQTAAPSTAVLQFGLHATKSIWKQCCATLLFISLALNYYLLSFVVLALETSTSVVQHGRTGGDNVHQEVAVVYGHLHLAKTAGTEINGELAVHFERVCGNKGYSYDAYQFNKRVNASGDSNVRAPKDLISQQYKNFNRGRVPLRVMNEIGFEDCDYISLEEHWRTWEAFKESPSLELHVPCRDPLIHLMSQCNHEGGSFNCSTDDLKHEIRKCILHDYRFSRALGERNITNLKCFNPIPIEPYLNYMSERLQRKRIESTYVHRDTNRPRNKSLECIWNEPDVATQVRDIMLQKYELYGWCEECMGSKDYLLADAQ